MGRRSADSARGASTPMFTANAQGSNWKILRHSRPRSQVVRPLGFTIHHSAGRLRMGENRRPKDSRSRRMRRHCKPWALFCTRICIVRFKRAAEDAQTNAIFGSQAMLSGARSRLSAAAAEPFPGVNVSHNHCHSGCLPATTEREICSIASPRAPKGHSGLFRQLKPCDLSPTDLSLAVPTDRE